MNAQEREKALAAKEFARGSRFKHWKGATCRILHRTIDEATGKVLIIYAYEFPHRGHSWSRTYEDFTSLAPNGKPRFEPIDEEFPPSSGSQKEPKPWE